jgi:hypothetical protein
MRSWAAAEWVVWRLFVIAGCAAIALRLSSISTTPDTDPALAFSALVTSDEVARYESAVRAAVAEKSARCVRPVLRGAPSPGPATNDQRAFTDHGGLWDCITEWRGAAVLEPEGSSKLGPKQREVLERCGPIVAAGLRAAIAHEDACSGIALDLEAPSDGGMLSFLTAGKILSSYARQLAEGGDLGEALWLALETMRLGQDYARGRTNLIQSMLGTAMVNAAIDDAHAILDRGRAANLDELAPALDTLLASEPAFGEAAAVDGPFAAMTYALAPLKPSTHPPGMRGHTQSPDEELRARAVDMLVSVTAHSAKVSVACPADASLAACHQGFGRAVAAASSDGTLRSILLQMYVESQAPAYLTLFPTYVARRANSHSALIALRLRLEVLRRGCDRSALAKLATTPTLGDSVQLSYAADTLVIEPPAWAVDSETKPVRVRCP